MGSLLETARLEDERSQGEQDLRESEGRFRQISENMREIVFLMDHQDHRLLYVNQAFKERWGQPGRDFYERPMLWLEGVHPDDRPAVEAALAIQTSTGEFEVEYRIIRPDGTVRRIYDRTFPILNEAGEIYRIVGIAEDITERKRTEERLHETARLASIGELAAGVAHEINNPLTSVVGYSRDGVAQGTIGEYLGRYPNHIRRSPKSSENRSKSSVLRQEKRYQEAILGPKLRF